MDEGERVVEWARKYLEREPVELTAEQRRFVEAWRPGTVRTGRSSGRTVTMHRIAQGQADLAGEPVLVLGPGRRYSLLPSDYLEH